MTSSWIHVPARETFEGGEGEHSWVTAGHPAGDDWSCARCETSEDDGKSACPGKLVSLRALLVASEAVTVGEWDAWAEADDGWCPHPDDRSLDKPVTGVGEEDAARYCTWRYEQDSEPCGECGGSGRCDQHPVDDCECDPCRGSGRVLRAPCPCCKNKPVKICCMSHGEVRLPGCPLCLDQGPLTILSYRPATQAECEAARRPCENCEGKGRTSVDVDVVLERRTCTAIETVQRFDCCSACHGTGYTDPPYDPTQLRLVAVLA